MKAKREDLSIISYQKSPTSHHPGPGRLFNSPRVMDPFPASLKRFNLCHTNLCACGEVGDLLHFATSCPLTVCFHMTKPSYHLTEILVEKLPLQQITQDPKSSN
ncbi:hypothetical protein AVEN_259364-1 [Araneus ventricosus]|uniref:Uncharacterized protein n=1 Tax=Araneus ventricosus TaxID=182803 RepID=A0A4Y2DRL0_ARAVE|nr:hypothetical protein AVEN_259364-1 [Araneus ventricosus]